MSNERYYYSKESGKLCREHSSDDKKLHILYKTLPGRVLLKAVFARRYFSFLAGLFYSSKFSKKKLDVFLSEHYPNKEYSAENYNSFNEFFTRKEQRHITVQKNALLSPADSLTMCFYIEDNLTLNIKNSTYNLCELFSNKALAQKYSGGICFVHRLTLKDYHRYIFPCNGEITAYKRIKGSLHTVRPISGIKGNYFKNTRCITLFKSDVFNSCAFVEIGAMLVGKITNRKESGKFLQGEEKGMFEYGGSTIVQLFEKGALKPCEIIEKMSALGIETKMSLGEIIAHAEKN